MARLEQLLEQIKKDRDVRQNLIEIRQNISDESLRRRFMYQLGGDFSLLTELLGHEDPKVRRNAALILGMTDDEDVLPALFDVWEKEETLFVREDYLKAISGLDYREYIPRLKARIDELTELMGDISRNPEQSDSAVNDHDDRADKDQTDGRLDDQTDGQIDDQADVQADDQANNPLWDNDKHLIAELSRLRKMVERYEEQGRHHFIKMNPAPELLLRTNLLHADVTAEQIKTGAVHVMRGGVHVKGGDLSQIMQIRTWIECLFPIPGARPIKGDEKMIAAKLRDLKIGNYLNFLHEETGQPYRYRIELKSQTIPREKKGEYIRRIASRLDMMEKGKLLNSDSDYEVELRLIERKDHSLIPMLKLFTIPDDRFAYRKETTAQSTSATLAALAVSLAAAHLKEGAQILDPFCEVGTLLVERCLAVPADPVYGVDRFGEAIEKAKINSALTENIRHAPIHYINRDFFDFTHEYPFDEIISYLPKTSQEGETEADFAVRFLSKASGHLKDSAVLVLLTDAPQAMKDAVRDAAGYKIEEEYLLNERTGCTELILSYQKAE